MIFLNAKTIFIFIAFFAYNFFWLEEKHFYHMIKMRTLFNTLCHMLQRILESIKIVFADNRVSHFLCVASIEATHFYYAILFNEKSCYIWI